MTQEHRTIYYKDYLPPAYTVSECRLEFIIEEGSTRVDNVMKIVRLDRAATQLRLDGDADLELSVGR